MATGKITKRSVEAVTPTHRDEFLWDEEVRGFGLKITSKGVRTYLLQYRMGGRESPTRRITIGRHGSPWTPASARDEAERLLRLTSRGVDPRTDEKDRRRSAVSLAFDGYAERYLADYRGSRRPRTHKNVECNLRRHVIPVLRDKPMTEVTRRDIVAVLDTIPAGRIALRRSVFAHVRTLFSSAVDRGDIERSPFETLRSPPSVASRERVLTDIDLAQAWVSARLMGYPFGPLFRFLIVTGQRRNEVAGMDWREVDRSTAEWTIPAARTKNKKVQSLPLSKQAIAVLDEIVGQKQWPARGFVFTTNELTHVTGFSRAKRRLDRICQLGSPETATKKQASSIHAQADPWRIHDFRRTMATTLQRLGIRIEVTEAVLNHVGGSRSGVAGVYHRHTWAEEKRDALRRWGDHVEQLAQTASASDRP